MAPLLLITWWGNTIFPISFVDGHCSAVAEQKGISGKHQKMGKAARLKVAVDVALQRMGYDTKNRDVSTTVPMSALREPLRPSEAAADRCNCLRSGGHACCDA